MAACPLPWLKIGCSLPSWKPVNRVDQLGSARVENVCDEYTSGRALPMADHPKYLFRLAELELIDRHQRLVQRRVRAARFPAVKSLDTFDFPAIPSVNKSLLMELARCEYIQRRENVIAVGNSGTGKTHIALGLGLAACQRGMSVGFTSSSAGARVDGGPGREKAAEPAEADVPPRPADHRRIGLCTVVPNRRGATLRRFQPAACGSRCGAR